MNTEKLSLSDNQTFTYIIDAMRLFGFQGRGWMQGGWKVPDNSSRLLWFPRMFPRGDWHNMLSTDDFGKPKIVEMALTENGKSSIRGQVEWWEAHPDWVFVTFGRSPRKQEYRYLGTFKVAQPRQYTDRLVFDFVRGEETVSY